MSYADRIKPTSDSIITYLQDLKKKKYQIPTFQREVVWEKDNVKKLWDSIYKFYPIGSILIWKTDLKLHKHREIGGHKLEAERDLPEYKYILDGQQRTTSLLTSIYGGKIKNRDINPELYVDLSIDDSDDEEDRLYKEKFLFWDEIDDRNGEIRRNTPRKEKFEKGIIVKIRDIQEKFPEVDRQIYKKYEDYDHQYLINLRQMKNVLENYRIPFIELKDIHVHEVCQIFERINQEGKPLDIFDIVVAKTYRPADETVEPFYLRELITKFKEKTPGEFADIGNHTYLQMLAIIIRQNISDSGIHNITDKYLNNIKTEQIEEVWEKAKLAIKKTFDFFENYLHIKGPQLIPYSYFYITLVSYFYNNTSPNYQLLKNYFWYYSFHKEELLRNTTHLKNHVEKFQKCKEGERFEFEKFVIDKQDLRTATYSSKGRYSRAILSLLSNHEPKDWKDKDKSVISEIYYLLKDKPNLHHIFPLDYMQQNSGGNKLNPDSLMNIAFLRQITNLEISNKNPIEYIRDYNTGNFKNVLADHLIPIAILNWSNQEEMPENAFDLFIEKRIVLFREDLKKKLGNIPIQVIDTKGEPNINN